MIQDFPYFIEASDYWNNSNIQLKAQEIVEIEPFEFKLSTLHGDPLNQEVSTTLQISLFQIDSDGNEVGRYLQGIPSQSLDVSLQYLLKNGVPVTSKSELSEEHNPSQPSFANLALNKPTIGNYHFVVDSLHLQPLAIPFTVVAGMIALWNTYL